MDRERRREDAAGGERGGGRDRDGRAGGGVAADSRAAGSVPVAGTHHERPRRGETQQVVNERLNASSNAFYSIVLAASVRVLSSLA